MRGKGAGDLSNFDRFRITPAYAGKSSFQNRSFSSIEDHPRLCGEKTLFGKQQPLHRGSPPPMRGKVNALIACPQSEAGSPPPMRGKVPASPPVRNASGITPAYAGKSSFFQCYSCIIKDHPRLCGEKLHKRHFFHTCKGSPPPMRGKAPLL